MQTDAIARESTTEWTATLSDDAATQARRFGAKAARLAALRQSGFPVPDGFAVGRAALEASLRGVLSEGEWPGALARSGIPSDDVLESIRARIVEAPIDPRVVRAVATSLEALGDRPLAVRSSADAEDDAALSGAGIQETILNVRGEAATLRAIRECWASLWTRRALGYLARRAGRADAPVVPDVAMGVVVQELVAADVAGVAFTQNPISGDPDELVINCAFGLGPAVAQGLVSPDAYVVDRNSGKVRDRRAGDKHVELAARAPGEGIAVRPRAPAEARSLTLSDADASRVAALALAVERHLGGPADVEWAIADGRISLLQARPVTVTPAPPRTIGPATSRARTPPESTVWSNVNVGEALPGVATPLTWSVLSEFSERGFRHAFGALGCTVPPDAELVAAVRGRIYLNLSEFMAIARQVPGLSPRMLLSLGGGGGLDELERAAPEGRAGWFLRLPRTAGRFLSNQIGLAKRVEEFEAWFEEDRARFLARDLLQADGEGLAAALDQAEGALHRTGEIMLSAASSFLASYVLLRTLLARWLPSAAKRLEAELLTGLADLESAAPGVALCHVAAVAAHDPAARDVLVSGDPARLRLDSVPDGPLRRALERFLDAHGHRAPREAEIATPRWREDPTMVLAALRAILLGDRARALARVEAQRGVRARAMQELEQGLSGAKRSAVRHAVASAQRGSRIRERMRGRVTEVLGWYRRIALEVGRRLGNPEAAFFLQTEEIRQWLSGARPDVSALVRTRRATWERDRRLPDPPPSFVGHPPALRPSLGSEDSLTGLPASPGRARGPVRVLSAPADAGAFLPGEVLVVSAADVGWAPLFLSAAAIVAELGGPLSHASIVAREYGVPAVVNASGATRVLRTGDVVEVDGTAGTVVVVARAG